MKNNEKFKKPKAFISCSVRPEDHKFITAIEHVVKKYGFEPTGTVGRHVNYAEHIPVSMEKEIEDCDILVIAASPRYLQSELKTGKKPSYAIPEMLHVESAMAHTSKKPIVAFVLEGVNVGSFIPSIIQYFIVDSFTYKIQSSKQLKPFFKDLHGKVAKRINKRNKEAFKWLLVVGFAIYGIYTFIQKLYSKVKTS